MLKRIPLLLLTVLYGLLAVAQTGCVEFALQESSLSCNNTIEPVCGCNQITYPNSCVAKKSGVVAYVPGVCNKVDSIKTGTVEYLHGASLPDTTTIALYLSFYNDSLFLKGVLPVPVCANTSLVYSIGTNTIVLFPNVPSNCSDTCKKAVHFSVPIVTSSWYHIILNGYIDTIFLKEKPIIKQDTVDFITGGCLTNTKKQLSVNYLNESATVSGIAQFNCCASKQVIYSVNKSVITLTQVSEGICECSCNYAFQCKIPTLAPGMYRVKGCGFDTVVTMTSKITSSEDFKLSSDSVTMTKDGTINLSVICNDITGFALRNDNASIVDAKLFGKDIIVHGLQLGMVMLRITNKQGLEKVCKVVVAASPNLTISAAVLQLNISQKSYKLSHNIQTSGTSVVWRSTDSKVATVDATGEIMLQSAGTCLIIANILNSSISDTCILHVFQNSNTIFQINTQSKNIVTALDTTLTVGETHKLLINWFDNTEIKTLTYTSQDTNVLKIDKSGTLYAISPGSALVIAQYESIASDSIRIWVVPQTTISYNRFNINLSTVSIRFSEKISSMSDSLQYWSLVTDNSAFSEHPTALQMEAEQSITLQFNKNPDFKENTYIEVNNRNAICFANNSVLLPMRYKCATEIAVTLAEYKQNGIHVTQNAVMLEDDLLPAAISIISMDGRVLKNEFITQNYLDITNLTTGQYILQITSTLQSYRSLLCIYH